MAALLLSLGHLDLSFQAVVLSSQVEDHAFQNSSAQDPVL